MNLTVSLVIYQNSTNILKQTLTSLFNTPYDIKLYVIDNSPSRDLEAFFSSFENVDYSFNNGNNYGFGKAHNIAIQKSKKADYHLILNPDVYFEPNVIPELIEYFDKKEDVGLLVPKISFPNGDTQHLCKRYPTLLVLFARKFIPKKFQFVLQKPLDFYEMGDLNYEQPIEVPIVSGCFMLFRRKYLDEIGYFDEKIFMYFEDFDLSIRMSKKYKVVLYPLVNIYHHWARGAHKKISLTIVFIKSAIYFFNKHGWKFF